MDENFRSSLCDAIARAGLTREQAAACALARLAFGARPGEVDRVAIMGVETWIEEQLEGGLPEPVLESKLASFPALRMTEQQLAWRYPDLGKVFAEARYKYDLIPPRNTPVDPDWRKRKIDRFCTEQGYLDQQEYLYQELTGQKIMRAHYSENQLAEVLTDFWFNHFYVSFTKFGARLWILPYEKDVIRPRVLGKFGDLVGATARHPAMLLYLDNSQSVARENTPTTMKAMMEPLLQDDIDAILQEILQVENEEEIILSREFRARAGINENYARELMELHTLGVDGGYTQQDVSEVARALTGWTVHPFGCTDEWFKTGFDRGRTVGFLRDGHFLFRPDWHDASSKTILGKTFAAGRGIEEGQEVLELLAAHPATAQFVCRKLAARFVSDVPPPDLVDCLAASFLESGGNLRRVMECLITAPAFWQAASQRLKVKSPFDLAISASRAIDAEITETRELTNWIGRMGQPLYSFKAPTGFPDRGGYWINASALLSRMSFGLNMTMGKIPGIEISLPSPAPDSPRHALEIYTHSMLATRADSTVQALTVAISAPAFIEELDDKPAPADPLVRVAGADRVVGAARDGFEQLYQNACQPWLGSAGAESFAAMKMLADVDLSATLEAGGPEYAENCPLGNSLRQIAQLIKSDIGLAVAWAEYPPADWDTHTNHTGMFSWQAGRFAKSLAAFYASLGDLADDVVVMTMTEFGRTVAENGSSGTDHGRATVFFVLGKDVAGGHVYGTIPRLDPDALEDQRDLPVTTDFRAVFAEVAAQHLGAVDSARLFPGWNGVPTPLFRAVS